MASGRLDDARLLISEALARGRAAGADYWVLRTLVYAAEVDAALGELDAAIVRGRETVEACRSLRRTGLLGHALCNLAGYLLERNAVDEARAALREALPLARGGEIGSIVVAMALLHLARIAAHEQRFERAARLAGYAQAFDAAEFDVLHPLERQSQARLMAALREALPPAALDVLLSVGAAWSEDQAVGEALAA